MSKDELAKIPNGEFNNLMEYYEIKKMPLNDASKKILASKIYLKIHNIENIGVLIRIIYIYHRDSRGIYLERKEL